MNKGHKEYQIFQKICRTVGLEEKDLAAKINEKGTEDIAITTHDKKTDMSYILNVIGKGSGHEYFMELFEAHEDGEKGEKKIILKGHVMTRPPPIKRKPALTAIMGVIILIVIAAVGAGAFYVAIEDQFEPDEFIEVESFVLKSLNADLTQFLLEMTVLSSNENLKMSSPAFVENDIVLLKEDEFEDRQGHVNIDEDGCVMDKTIAGFTAETCVLRGQSGYLITYQGIITLTDPNTDRAREQIQIQFESLPNGITTIESFEVPN